MDFSDTLRMLIEEKDITQKELAKQLHLAPSTLGSYVQGSREPDFSTLKQIADYFEVSTDYLLGHYTASISSPLENELLLENSKTYRFIYDDTYAFIIGGAFILYARL